MGERLPTLPERAAVKQALRRCGLSDRQVRALLVNGWKGLVGEAQAEADDLRDQLAELSRLTGAS